jgi:peroxiredoxin
VIRSTFLIANGKIKRSWGSVKVDGHAEAVLEALSEE